MLDALPSNEVSSESSDDELDEFVEPVALDASVPVAPVRPVKLESPVSAESESLELDVSVVDVPPLALAASAWSNNDAKSADWVADELVLALAAVPVVAELEMIWSIS